MVLVYAWLFIQGTPYSPDILAGKIHRLDIHDTAAFDGCAAHCWCTLWNASLVSPLACLF